MTQPAPHSSPSPTQPLATTNHDRDNAGMTYVYPVVSRRAGGVSIGINLNINNACNWRCIYCQVPNLKRGGPVAINLPQLEDELQRMLTDIVFGDFMQRCVPADMRQLNDIALSGNGEPTSAPEFPAVVELIGRVLANFKLTHPIKLVLITNGSLTNKAYVQQGLRRLAQLNGEVWFKFDRATAAGMKEINDTETDPERHYQRMKTTTELCPTWLQSCFFSFDGAHPKATEIDAWLSMLQRAKTENIALRGIFIYGLARPSLQAEAVHLGKLAEDWLQALANQITSIGWPVRVIL
jgi:wyosine [tRNA(Phe)-imidazoG37] synthetase (radical SAM superfamily)